MFPTYGIDKDLGNHKKTTLKLDGEPILFQRLGQVSLQGNPDQTTPKSLQQALYLFGIPLDQLMRSYVQNKSYQQVYLGTEIKMNISSSAD